MPSLPVKVELTAELAFPVGEGTATGFL